MLLLRRISDTMQRFNAIISHNFFLFANRDDPGLSSFQLFIMYRLLVRALNNLTNSFENRN